MGIWFFISHRLETNMESRVRQFLRKQTLRPTLALFTQSMRSLAHKKNSSQEVLLRCCFSVNYMPWSVKQIGIRGQSWYYILIFVFTFGAKVNVLRPLKSCTAALKSRKVCHLVTSTSNRRELKWFVKCHSYVHCAAMQDRLQTVEGRERVLEVHYSSLR